MAEINSTFGDIRGKVGNLILYKGRQDKTLCRGSWLKRRASNETQKRQSTVFGMLAKMKRMMKPIIHIGFPGNGKALKGCNAFVSANWKDVISVEKINPKKKISKRKTAMKEFKGEIDFRKLRVAAGPLLPPTVEVEVEKEQVRVRHKAVSIYTADCFLNDRVYIGLVDNEKLYSWAREICHRSESGEFVVPFPEIVSPEKAVIYAFAISADGLYASDSVCLYMPAEEA